MEFLAVNFHHVGYERSFQRGIFPISQEAFSKQLKELEKYFTFIDQNDMLDAIFKKKKLPDKSCLISFDDGLRCQYKYALPVLDDLGIPAIFFVSTYPYVCGKVLHVHKIHWCLANMSQKELLNNFRIQYEQIVGKDFSFSSFKDLDILSKYQYPYDEINDARLKYLLNKDLVPLDIRKKIIDNIFNLLESNEAIFIQEFYLAKDEICNLYERSYLGFHGHNHNILSALSDEEIEEDFSVGLTALDGIISEGTGKEYAKIMSIAYPHGTINDMSKSVFETAKRFGFKFGFTMRRQINQSLENPLELHRFDCNDIPGGKNPFFQIVKDTLIFK